MNIWHVSDFDKLQGLILLFDTLTVRTVKRIRSIRGSALVHIINDIVLST